MSETIGASVEKFHYPPSGLPAPSMWREIPEVGSDFTASEELSPQRRTNLQNAMQDDAAESISEAARRSFDAGRAQGVEEGRQLERAEQRVSLQETERRRIETTAQLAEQIARERDSILGAIEPEIVKLALSIARRILVHEAQMDPLFLAGAVRVALGQLAETVTVRLRVPDADFTLWSQTIEHLPNLKIRPTVISDKELHLGDCVIETEMGSADLGVDSQLREIARGLFDGLRDVEKPSAAELEDLR